MPIVNRIVIDIEFESDIDIKAGTIVSLYLPQIKKSNIITDEPAIVENYIAMPILWNLTWYGLNQTLHLIARTDIQASVQQFSIESEVLVLSDTIIYEDSNDISYSIISPADSEAFGGYMDRVAPTGFASTSLEFSNRQCNESTAIIIGFVSDQTFEYGDKIVVKIPSLINSKNYGRKNELNITATSMTNVSAYMYVIWNDVDSSFVLNILKTFKSLESLIITEENGFKIPVDGVSNKTGIPTIQLRSNWELFGPAPFASFQPISSLVNATITFKPIATDMSVHAGQDVTVSLYFEYSTLGFFEYDTVSIFLPRFWSHGVSDVFTNDSNFKATWIQCEEVLVIQVINTNELISSFDLDIYGLRLPEQGVNVSLASYFQVSTNSSSGQFGLTPLTYIDTISHVLESAVVFEQAKLGTAIAMTLSFTLVTQLERNDVISIYLPSIDVLSLDTEIRSSHNVSFQWQSTSSTLTVTVNEVIMPTNTISIYSNVSLPSTGFPPVDSALAHVAPTISLSGVNGFLHSVSIKSIDTVGLKYGAVHYGLFNELSDEISLRLQFHLSGSISQGDTIKVYIPYIYNVSSMTSIVATGDQAEDDFSNPFTISTNIDPTISPDDRYVLLEASYNSIASREINIFIDYGSNIFLDRSSMYENRTHLISANLTSFGILENSTLDYFPKEMNRVTVINGVNTSLCPTGFSVADEYTLNDCSIDVELNLSRDLLAGESIIISHEGLSQSMGSSFIPIASDASAYFDAFWRDADNVDSLSLSSPEIGYIESGYIHTHATHSYFSPNTTIPIEKTTIGTSIVSNIPRILAVYVPDCPSDLTCNDMIFIHMKFTESVMASSSKSKILLNTLEYAYYYDGNGTDLIRFKYNVDAPVKTADLSVHGPSALELGGTFISRYGRVDIVANLTIPRPYNNLLRNKSTFGSIAVSCEQKLMVNKVYSLRDGNKTYFSGDIIDIAVEFNRDLAIVGSPSLALSNDSVVFGMYKGIYLNVFTTQIISIQSSNIASTYFQVLYNSESTKCVLSTDLNGLYTALISLQGLRLSLPVDLSLAAIPNGYRYTLNFTGVAPEMLSVSNSACDNEITTNVSVSSGESTFNTLVFRYVVGDSDVADKLHVNSVLQDSSNYVYLRGHSAAFPNISMILPKDQNSFENTTSITVELIRPSVEYLESPSAGVTVVSGDHVDIFVVFTAPIIVFGYPILELKFDSTLSPLDSGEYLRYVPMHDTTENSIQFRYYVEVGDQANILEVNSTHSLYLNGSEIKLNSLHPTVDADIALPFNTTDSLSMESVKVEAVTVPVVNIIYPDKEKGVYSTGELIYIYIQFSSPVQVIANSTAAPYALFGNNTAGQTLRMYYFSGTNTSVITFLYTVESGDDAEELVLNRDNNGFFVSLEHAQFYDYVGNIWNTSYVNSSRFEKLSLITISTVSAVVERVDVVQVDGVYYPGQALDIYIKFNKKVAIFPNPLNGRLPSLALFIPFQDEAQLLAFYSYGNGTTELHFEYLIPVPNSDYNIHPEVTLNYEGVSALSSHMFGGTIRDAAVNAVTDANVLLPAMDKSYLLYSRSVKIVFARPKVSSISFVTPNGVYGVGDRIRIAVAFTQPVMVFEPPVLKLYTSYDSPTVANRSAIYESGNYSSTLYYAYVVQDGDRSSDHGLDCIDTRFPPYDIPNFHVSLALNSDIIKTNTGRVSIDGGFTRDDDIVLTPTKMGGIFRATNTQSLILASTELPVPGDVGSLSYNYNVIIDTRSPNITGVYTPLHNGSYGAGVVIPVLVSFNYPVVVRGCPRLLIRVGNVDKYAKYASGSSTDKLLFDYTVNHDDYKNEFDYFHTSALSVVPCTFEDEEMSAKTDENLFYIKRMSAIPTADINYTLPFVTYVETVIAPVSVTGGGSYISMVGSRASPKRVVASDSTNNKTYGIGDVVKIGIEYSESDISVANGVYLLMENISHGSYFSYIDTENSNLAWFSLVILQYDITESSLAYRDSFSLYSSALCDIKDRLGACAAYNLPAVGSDGDQLSNQQIILTDTQGIITSISMISSEVSFALDNTDSILGIPLRSMRDIQDNDVSDFGKCEPSGYSYVYNEVADTKSDRRKIITTSCPNHFCTEQTITADDESSAAKVRDNAYEIPLHPVIATNPINISCLLGDIGIALNGVPFGGPAYLNGDDTNNCETIYNYRQSVDKCGGVADKFGNYRYSVPPSCLIEQLNHEDVNITHSPQIGWALDGFPIYGPKGIDGMTMVPCSGNSSANCLDECNGYLGSIPDIDNFKYRYYVNSEVGNGECSTYILNGVSSGKSGVCDRESNACCVNRIPSSSPFIIGCFKGCLLSDPTCVSLESGLMDINAPYVVPQHPTGLYDGTIDSTQTFMDQDIKVPTDSYYPNSVWDLVSNVTNEGNMPYTTGSVIQFIVYFSEAVIIEGSPSLILYFSESDEIDMVHDTLEAKHLRYSHMKTSTSAVFDAVIDASFASTNGNILCSRYSKISLNGGRVVKEANFLPLRDVDLSLGALCCSDTCDIVAQILTSYDHASIDTVTPYVTRVYSTQSGSFANPDEINIFVEFSTPVSVIGYPYLVLDLADYPQAYYLMRSSMNTLQFRYTISASDFSTSFDYVDTYSLKLSQGMYDNIVKAGVFEYIPADISLPPRGTVASLGRSSSIVIDNSRAKIISVTSPTSVVTAGDEIIIEIAFDQIMAVPDYKYSSVTLSFSITDGNFTVTRQANIVSTEDSTTIIFAYMVTVDDPTGSVVISEEYPLVYSSSQPSAPTSYIRTAINNVKGPTQFLLKFLLKSICSIDNAVPVVLSIISPNVGNEHPWGAGDSIDIYVTMTLPVVVITEPSMLLALQDRTSYATFMPSYHREVNGTHVKHNATGSFNVTDYELVEDTYISVLHFRYIISDGDIALPLQYATSYSLVGDIRRYSANPLLGANLTLPSPSSPGSLSFSSSVNIDTSPPYVESLFPAKRAGVYGTNEEIVIVARFNKPVMVIGNPTLILQTGSDVRGYANYTEYNSSVLYSSVDVASALDILSTDVLFTYVVKNDDNIVNIHHEGVNSMVLLATDQILHLTTIPTTAADVELRDPTDFHLVNGQISKQWKFRYPRKVELILRSLYHTDVSTLKVELEHDEKKAEVFDNVLHHKGKAFELGRSFPRSRQGNNETIIDTDTGIGYTYFFADTLLPNIAVKSVPQQSSTSQSASYAIDGNSDPLLSHYSVTETDGEIDAWWQILLPAGSKVATINVYPRKPQKFVFPIVRVLMKGYDDYPKGRFCIRIDNFDSNDPTASRTTSFIQFGSSAAQVKSKIIALEGIGEVDVSMTMLDLCGVDNPGGCGSDDMKGYGYQYHIEFLSVQVPAPTVTVDNITWIGGTVENGGINETANMVVNQLHVDVTTTRLGFWHEVSNVDEYGMGISASATNNTIATESATTSRDNQWLTPFWVMLFDTSEPPPSDLEEALTLAKFKEFYESIGEVCETTLPAAVDATYVRIQRFGYGALSLAEVEVYEESLNTFSSYRSTSPIIEAAVTRPYQPSVPFMHEFNSLPFDGRWTVHITQSGEPSHGNTKFGYGGAYGTISDAVLVITDIVGITHSYYQDLSAEVMSLPKYGKLYKSRSYSANSYGDWRDLFDIAENGQLVAREGGARYMGYCYGVDTSGMTGVRSGVDGYRHCVDNYGVPPELAAYTVGDQAIENFLRDERVVIYKPNSRYLGPDGFTYKVYDGVNEQVHIIKNGVLGYLNEVTVHVRTCRMYEYKVSNNIATTLEPICDCEQSEYSIFKDEQKCNVARIDICQDASKYNHYYAMCVACNYGYDTSECIGQTTRALGLMTSKGLCSTLPRTDCSDETVTVPGRDRINYMSLKAPMSTYHSFTTLGNSFGFSQL